MSAQNPEGLRPTPAETGSVFLSRKIDRRTLFKGAAAAGVTLISPIPRYQEASAANAQDSEDSSSQETRYKYVRDIEPTSLDFDHRLSDSERKVRIDGIVLNPFREEFNGLKPDNPQDRLDLAFVMLCAGLYRRTHEYKDLPDRPMNNDEIESTIMYQRTEHQTVEEGLPKRTNYRRFIADLEKDKKMRIPIWAYDDKSRTSMDFHRTEFDPRKGMEVYILYDRPKNIVIGREIDPDIGFTQKVINGKLQIGIYHYDYDPESSVPTEDGVPLYTPSKDLDLSYSSALSYAIERLILYAGRYDIQRGNDVRYFEGLMFDMPGRALFGDIAELIRGPLSDGKIPLYNTAPVLHILSPDVDPYYRTVTA